MMCFGNFVLSYKLEPGDPGSNCSYSHDYTDCLLAVGCVWSDGWWQGAVIPVYGVKI
jgi:hypothetical protein